MSVEPLGPGALVGKYVVVRELGRGGMGAVYEAREPDLGRSVALKVLHRESPLHAQRLLREAKTLAQLQHPNIVGVHALETRGDQLVVVMELVDGETLEAYIARGAPDWRAVLALYRQAGEGLAAAHAKGIVHRDVKPANMFVDASGRVRVGDFGIARQLGDDEPASTSVTADLAIAETLDGTTPDDPPLHPRVGEPQLTQPGAVLGTPRFMAPEQLAAARATPSSDQFSFCVSLWLALYGAHPFADEAHRERRAPRPKRAVPRAVEAALDRGLSLDPKDRFPSMPALLAALQPRPRMAYVIAGLAVAGVGVGAIALATRSSSASCPVPEVTAWTAARRTALSTQATALDATAAKQVVAAIDMLVADWSKMYVASCEATRMRGEQSDTMYEARARCLRQTMQSIEVGIALVEAARTPAALADASRGVILANGAAACTAAALTSESTIPLPPAIRAQGDALAHRVAALDATARGAWRPALSTEIADVVGDARALGHVPTLLLALWAQMRIEKIADHYTVVEANLREIALETARLHDFTGEANAWVELLSILSWQRSRPDEARALIPVAKGAVVRANEPALLQLRLAFAEAQILSSTGKMPAALEQLAATRAKLARLEQTPELRALAINIVEEQGTTLARSKKFAESGAAYAEAIDMIRALFGSDTMDEAHVLANTAEMLKDAKQLDRAREAIHASLRIHERRGGATGVYANSFNVLATIEGYSKQWDAALAAYDRAIAIRRGDNPDDPDLVPSLFGRAWVLDSMGRKSDALPMYDAIIELGERQKLRSFNVAAAYNNRAEYRAAEGKHAAAASDFEHTLTLLEDSLGRDSTDLRYPLMEYARELVALARYADAIATAERAAKLVDAETDPLEAIEVRGTLAYALVASKQDIAKGKQLAKELDAQLATMKGSAAADLRKTIRRWAR